MLFCVFLGGVLLVLGSVQVMAVRDLRMMSGLFMIAGFMMFGCFAMVLGRVLMMLRGVLVVLMNLVIVHGSLSGLLEKTRSIAAFDERFATPRCQIGASAALRRAAGAFAELRHVLSYLPHDIVPIVEARLPVKPCGRIPWAVRPPAQPAEIRGVGQQQQERLARGPGQVRDRGVVTGRCAGTGPYQLAGSVLRPRKTKVCRQAGCSGSSSCRPGKRRNSVAIAISPSMRASWAPRQ